MANLTATAQNALLDALLRHQTFVPPANLYIALVTVPGVSNILAGTEVHGGSYARAKVSPTLANWAGTQGAGTVVASSGSSGATSNNLAILYPNPTSNWGSIVGYEIWDDPTSGNRWLYDTLPVPMVVSSGDPPVSFPPGALAIAFA